MTKHTASDAERSYVNGALAYLVHQIAKYRGTGKAWALHLPGWRVLFAVVRE